MLYIIIVQYVSQNYGNMSGHLRVMTILGENVLNCHTCVLFITYIVINTLQYFCSSSDPKHEFYICYFRCSIFNMCRYITCLASNGGSFNIIKSLVYESIFKSRNLSEAQADVCVALKR